MIDYFFNLWIIRIIHSLHLHTPHRQGRIQPVSLGGGAISVIFGSQVSVGSQVYFRIVQNHGEKSYFRKFHGERSP